MQKILKTYLKRLTNLTSRNRSLLLLNLSQEQFFDIHELNFLDSKPSFEIIENLIAQKQRISLTDILDPRLEKSNEASKKLRKIARTEQIIEEERGANDLYVGYPFVKGKLLDGTIVRCPLLFFPVSLKKNLNKWILEKRDENISFNRSFLLAYSHFNQIKIEDEWLENSFDDFSKDSLQFRTELYEFLKKSPLEINFNQELFQNQLIDYQKLTKQDLEISEKNGELKLYPHAVLGIFPQGGSFLVDDYEILISGNGERGTKNGGRGIENENSKGLDSIFINSEFRTVATVAQNSEFKEQNSFLPFNVDASQEEAIKMVKEGKSIVVQGPPGTGKSQLICNLVADFTARGKKVLVVCQKRVALDTVFNRLESIGMRDFVGLVHDFKNDRKVLFEKIANQIEKIEDYQKQNKSLDSIFLERNFTQNSRRIDQICRELDEFKTTLFDDSICGVSIKELYLTSSPNKPFFEFQDLHKLFNFNELADFETKLKRFYEYEKAQLHQPIFWQNRVSFHRFNFHQIKEIEHCLNEILNFNSSIPPEINFLDLVEYDEQKVEKFYKYFQNAEIERIFFEIKNYKKYLQNRSFDITKILSEIESLFSGFGIENTIEKELLQIRKVQVNKAIEVSKNFFSFLNWKLLSKDRKDVEKIALDNNFQLQITDLELLIKKIDNRIVFELNKEKLERKEMFINQNQNFEDIQKTLKNYILANEAYQFLNEYPFIENHKYFDSNFRNSIQKFREKIVEAKQKYANWKKYLSIIQIEEFLKNDFDKTEVLESLNQNFDLMYEQDVIKNSFSQNELLVVGLLKKCLTANPIETFQNSLRLAWIQEIENRFPILRGVSSLKIKQLEEELQNCIQQKQALSQEIILLKLREQTYKDLAINRLQNVVSYRELSHQVNKKRKIWSIRKLIENYQEEIFKLIPCWMASPESVSAMFELSQPSRPMERGGFDLVIFDEASQCYAENAIPAIFRGKQVVIAGDSKQLQPNDLYQIRFEEEIEDEPILEIDSLLDLATQYLPQTQLKGHYRSHSLDLIDFSNQYFYKNTLRLLPYFQDINQSESSIKYIKVDGFWQNNTNEIEAQKIVEIVKNLQKNQSNKTIGIVTFNFKQADLIEILLLSENDPIANSQQPIAIKNIENIQGDEFDFVIFSVGYAPDTHGKMLMNFGSLNQKGGENRLNVAVTRAKEKVFVVSSIFPNQLRVEESQNDGPKLLKKYLEFALQVSEGRYKPKPFESEKYKTEWLLKNQLISINNQQLPISNQQTVESFFDTHRSSLITYHSSLNFADITIKNQERYESLILTDDDLYFESSVKESHAYLPMNLQQKGWIFERIWSRNFHQKQ